MSNDRPRPFYRYAANRLTDIRGYGSYLLAARIATKGENARGWATAGIAAALMATDSVDGWLGRKSNIPDPLYIEKDEKYDKTLYRNMMAALAIATHDPRYVAYALLTDARNGIVEKSRRELRSAIDSEIENGREPDISSGARKLGKKKTFIQNIGILADLSPIGDTNPNIVHWIHKTAVGMTALSGADIVIDAERQLTALNSENLAREVEVFGAVGEVY